MQAKEFRKLVTMDQSNLLEQLLSIFEEHGIRYCVIGGQAVNAYVEPLVSLDIDVVVAVEQLERVKKLLESRFSMETFAHSVNLSSPDSDLRVQIQTDPRYASFLARAETRTVLGQPMRVASLVDVLRGKIWAAQDSQRRGSKRQKDFADIARIIEAFPELQSQVPEEILSRLV